MFQSIQNMFGGHAVAQAPVTTISGGSASIVQGGSVTYAAPSTSIMQGGTIMQGGASYATGAPAYGHGTIMQGGASYATGAHAYGQQFGTMTGAPMTMTAPSVYAQPMHTMQHMVAPTTMMAPQHAMPQNLRPHPDLPEQEVNVIEHPLIRMPHHELGPASYVGDHEGPAHLITHHSNFQGTHALPQGEFHHVQSFVEQNELMDMKAHTMHGGHPGGHFGPTQQVTGTYGHAHGGGMTNQGHHVHQGMYGQQAVMYDPNIHGPLPGQ